MKRRADGLDTLAIFKVLQAAIKRAVDVMDTAGQTMPDAAGKSFCAAA